MEEQLRDSFSVRDMFAQEKETRASDLKTVREQKAKLQLELDNTQEKMREMQAMQHSVREKTKEIYASDIAAVREEKTRVEAELGKVQEKLRQAQVGRASADASLETKSVLEELQKEFEV